MDSIGLEDISQILVQIECILPSVLVAYSLIIGIREGMHLQISRLTGKQLTLRSCA